MTPIVIHLHETSGIKRDAEPVKISVPLPQNTIRSIDQLILENPQTDTLTPCQLKPLAYWHDGSIRWLLVSFLMDIDASESLDILLRQTDNPSEEIGNEIAQPDSRLEIQTNHHTFSISANALTWTLSSPLAESSHKANIQLQSTNGDICETQFDNHWTIKEQGAVFTAIQASGHWLNPDQTLLARFNCTLRFYQHSSTVEAEVCIHNPNRAIHTGGLWDQGDAGAMLFRSLTINIETGDGGQAQLELDTTSNPIINAPSTTPLKIYQDSSGGDHWNSKNHINGEHELTTNFQGYRVYESDSIIHRAKRALPIMRWQKGQSSIQAYLRDFWQNFPSALTLNTNNLSIDLFPEDSKLPYELQGGESKTQTCFINYSNNPNALQWARAPLRPILDSHQYETAQAFPWFKASQPLEAIDRLISAGLNGENNFFAKREVIDEYGWRNFGDIFADHETLYQHDDESPYISHYNNQYDAVYGFTRQFALTGNPRWFDLMNDLAYHVTDIDIYQTDQDRAEYNNGLFWHTDHYLDAHTATHRTYSKHNDTSSIPGQTGGGPAAEHCYTTGLLYHYFLTGNERSRQAVLSLAHWMIANHEGSGGLLEQLLAIKKHDLPNLKAIIKGNKPSPHCYPFTRGTGNYLNAVLDAQQLTGEKQWLDRAETIIKSTFHPDDDIAQRDLLNAEVAWSYLVFLLSVAKYLDIKQKNQPLDENYFFILSAFCHYTRWMAKHERPCLYQPDQLEFPNETWTAQDIRKVMLMHIAASLDPTFEAQYTSKADDWLNYIIDRLEKSPEAHNSRVLVILMQNHGPHQWDNKSTKTPTHLPLNESDNEPPILKASDIFGRIFSKLIKGIKTFRPRKEYHWLKTRIDK